MKRKPGFSLSYMKPRSTQGQPPWCYFYLLTYQEEHRFASVTSQLVGACTVPAELAPFGYNYHQSFYYNRKIVLSSARLYYISPLMLNKTVVPPWTRASLSSFINTGDICQLIKLVELKCNKSPLITCALFWRNSPNVDTYLVEC
jgi:hypothetical protein